MKSIALDFVEGVRDLSRAIKPRRYKTVRGKRIRDDLGAAYSVRVVNESAPPSLLICRAERDLLRQRARWHYRRATKRGPRLVHQTFIVGTVTLALATAAYLVRSGWLLESWLHSVGTPIALTLFAAGLIAFELSPLASPRRRRARDLSKLRYVNAVLRGRWYSCPVCTYELSGTKNDGRRSVTCPECGAGWNVDNPVSVHDTR